MRKLLALVLTATMPLVGVAQSPAPQNPLLAPAHASPQLLEQMLDSSNLLGTDEARTMPLWGTPDGRILTLVAAGGNHDPVLPMSPQIGSAWRLIDVTNLVSGGLLMRLGNSTSVYAGLGHTSLSPPLTGSCTVAPSAACAAPALAHGGTFRLGTNWLAGDNIDLGLSYDLAWLRHDLPAPTLTGSLSSGMDLAGLGTPSLPFGLSGYSLLDAQNAQVSAVGRFRLDDDQSLNLGASLGRIQFSVPGTSTPLTSLNQAAVTFGVQYGSFGGNLTGHVLSPADPLGAGAANSRMSGLDLGISWRTPWSGMFRFGAQNLWSSGNLPYLGNSPAGREVESSQARVPYVQYHQDL